MLEPVALHQTGFKVPGLAQDARGVVVGTHAATLLLGLDRLVALLRLLSEELQLDDVLPSLRIELVRNSLGAQAYLLRLVSADSLLLDRLARPARLCGAVLCVGAGKHFVPYRDRRAPLGYDARELLADPPAAAADYVFYSEAAAQPFARVRELALLAILSQLTLLATPGGPRLALRAALGLTGGTADELAGTWGPERAAETAGAAPGEPRPYEDPLWLTAPIGLLGRVAGYLWERGVRAELAMPDVLPSLEAGAAPVEAVELVLLRLLSGPAGLLERLLAVPGLRLYLPVAERLAVELGYTHPLRLGSLASLFAAGRLYLFSGTQRGFTALPVARLMPLERLIELRRPAPASGREEPSALATPRPAAVVGAEAAPSGAPVVLRVQLQLVPQPAERGRRTPTATLVPWQRALWLSRLLYTLPAALLGGLVAACIDEGVLVLGAQGVHGLPLGTLLYEPTARVFIPLGWEFLPRLPGELLAAQLGGVSDRCVVFLPGQAQPLALPRAQLQPLTQQLLAPLLPTSRSATLHGEPPSPELHNTPISSLSTFALWPLWGRLEEDKP